MAAGEPLEGREVRLHQLEVARQHVFPVAQHHDAEDLARGAGADGRVVLGDGEARAQLGVVGDEPPEAQAGSGERLREAARARRHSPRARRPTAAGAPPRARGSGTSRRRRGARRSRRPASTMAANSSPVGRAPVGLWGKLTTTSLVDWAQRSPQSVEVEAPAVGSLLGPPEAHLAAPVGGELVERLIAGEGRHDVVAGLEQHAHRQQDALLGDDLEHLVGVESGVETGDLAAQQRQSGRLRVAEAETIPELLRLGVGAREDLRLGQGFAIGAREQVAGAELVAREVAFEGEGRDLHGRPPGRRGAPGGGLQPPPGAPHPISRPRAAPHGPRAAAALRALAVGRARAAAPRRLRRDALDPRRPAPRRQVVGERRERAPGRARAAGACRPRTRRR